MKARSLSCKLKYISSLQRHIRNTKLMCECGGLFHWTPGHPSPYMSHTLTPDITINIWNATKMLLKLIISLQKCGHSGLELWNEFLTFSEHLIVLSGFFKSITGTAPGIVRTWRLLRVFCYRGNVDDSFTISFLSSLRLKILVFVISLS